MLNRKSENILKSTNHHEKGVQGSRYFLMRETRGIAVLSDILLIKKASAGRTLALCLREVASCAPYFVTVLGQRYGSRIELAHIQTAITELRATGMLWCPQYICIHTLLLCLCMHWVYVFIHACGQ